MSEQPTTSVSNGDRDASGKFVAGNKAAKGNPLCKQMTALRVALLEAVTPKDMAAIGRTLVTAAKGGDVQAAKLLMDRTMGRVPDAPEDPEDRPVTKRDMDEFLADVRDALGLLEPHHRRKVTDELTRLCEIREIEQAEQQQGRSDGGPRP